jgi:hypothetical protein
MIFGRRLNSINRRAVSMMKNAEKFLPWIAFAAILLIYLLFPARNYFFDGIAFAQAIEDARRLDTSLIHPNHLLYNVVGYLFYKLLQAVGIHLRSIQALQVMDGILSALSAYVLFRILRLSVRSLYLCWVLTLLFAFSATWWKFSTDADAYIPSVLFLLISFYFIHLAQKPRPLLVALAFSLSMFFHQLAVFFYPVAVAGLFLQTTGKPARQRVLTILEFSAAGFILTCGTYYYCFYISTGKLDLPAFIRWTTSFSPDASFTFNAWANMVHTIRGHVRLLFGGRFNLIKGLINPFIAALMLILAAAISVFVWKLARNYRDLKFRWQQILSYEPQSRPLTLLCALWAAVYIAFLFVWLPFHTFYRLFYLPALILLAGLVLAPYASSANGGHKYRAALLVAIIALSNFLFIVFPYSHAEKYPPLALALDMNRTWHSGTVIYYANTNADNALFKYVNPITDWRQMKSDDARLPDNLVHEIDNAGGTIWLDASAIDRIASTPEGAAWLSAHAREQTRREINDKSYYIKFIQVLP